MFRNTIVHTGNEHGCSDGGAVVPPVPTLLLSHSIPNVYGSSEPSPQQPCHHNMTSSVAGVAQVDHKASTTAKSSNAISVKFMHSCMNIYESPLRMYVTPNNVNKRLKL